MTLAYEERLESEIAHGRKLAPAAERVWNWEGRIGRARLERRRRFLCEGLGPGVRVLELGCGTGLLTEALAATGAEVTAVDISPDLLEKAAAKIRGVKFLRADACATGLPDASFDAVVGLSVLHHLELGRALAEIFRLLKPGGRARFSEPNMLNPHVFLQKNVRWLKEKLGDSRHETAFVRGPLARAFGEADFHGVFIEPFDFLYPFMPEAWLGGLERAGAVLEKAPLLREIAGSLAVRAEK